jgi:membrane fusion protein, multidrug efflux system
MTTENILPKTSSHSGHGDKHPAPSKWRIPPQYKRRVFGVIATLIGIYCVWFLYDYWTHEETDNAYVTGHLHYVSPRVSGVIEEVHAEDNQLVKAGDVLVKLDPRDLKAELDAAKASFDKAQLDFNRNKELVAIDAVSKQELEHAQSALDVAKARLDTATLQLSYTTITAPADGRIGRKNAEIGNRVQPGQSLMVVVQSDVWVIANYKEAQLAGMKVGSPVRLTIDAIPNKTFTGKIDSFSPASGNQFALLPADNSTGNFTKIAQRVPVKIVFDPESIKGYEDQVRPGLSVVAKIRIH